MALTFGRLRFAPDWRLTLLTVVIFAGLVRLGFWQMDRADQKRQLMQDYTNAGEVVVNLAQADVPRFSRVAVEGRWDRDTQFLLDNMVHESQAGFHVLVPLLRSDAEPALLVNLGWVSSTGRRDQPPTLAPLEPVRIQLEGRLNRLPEPGIRLNGAAEDQDKTWPRIVIFPDIKELESQLGYELYPLVLFLERPAVGPYVRAWQPVKFGPERHLGYALQWFALALALLVIFLVVNTRRLQGE